MTKKDLIKAIQDYSDDTQVYLSPFQSPFNSDAPMNLVRDAQMTEYVDDGNGGVKIVVRNITNSICLSTQTN